jgi:CubicO group peptidase (beta-lactamase class C family)
MLTAWPEAAGDPLHLLTKYIERVMTHRNIPGLGVVVIQDGKILGAKCFGFQDIEAKIPLAETSLCVIGSVAKSMVATTFATLVDERRIGWDTRVRELLPEFAMQDDHAAKGLTIRDILAHRSGMPGHYFAWLGAHDSMSGLIHRAGHLDSSADLGTCFQYNNLLYIVAGHLLGIIDGTTWEEAVRRRVLSPLGMTGSFFVDSSITDLSSFSFGYARGDSNEELHRCPFDPSAINNWGVSTLVDMSKFLMFQANMGEFNGNRIVSTENVAQMQTAQVIVSAAQAPFSEIGQINYGLGLYVSTYRNQKIIEHGGKIPGHSSYLAVLPHSRNAVFVFMNLNESVFARIVAYDVLDRLLGIEPAPWNERVGEIPATVLASEVVTRQGFAEARNLNDYVGAYVNPGYGRVEVRPNGSNLEVTFNNVIFPLRHFRYDVFELNQSRLGNIRVRFDTDLHGTISSLSIPFEPLVKPILFNRIPEGSLSATDLQSLTGEYELWGNALTIKLRDDNQLAVLFPGNREHMLIPLSVDVFDVGGRLNTSIEFVKDKLGMVQSAVWVSNGRTTKIKRKNTR